MKNKVIAIYDFNDFKRQNIEALLFSNVLEKKHDSLNVLDLNDANHNRLLKKLKWKEKNQILTAKVFDITSYHFCSNDVYSSEKLYKLATSLKDKSEILIINSIFSQEPFNIDFFNLADELILFADLNNHLINDVISFFIMHRVEHPKVWLFVINKESNIQNEKAFIGLRKQLSKSNVILESIDHIPDYKTLDELKNVDPWLEIYKKINSTF